MAAVLAAVLLSFAGTSATRATGVSGPLVVPAFDTGNLDATCPACKDFFQYATGGWRAKNPIPPEYSSWGRFATTFETNQVVLRGILENAASDTVAAPGSTTQKIGTFYKSCMNTEAIEAAGLKPLTAQLAAIENIQTRAAIQRAIERLQPLGVNLAFGFGSAQDAKKSTRVIGEIDQAGLGLPDRDYYTKTDVGSVKLRAQYAAHVANILALSGETGARSQADARTILGFETQLARAQLTNVQLRDPNASYHLYTVATMRRIAPAVSWPAYFSAIGSPPLGQLNISEPGYLTEVSTLFDTAPLSTWRAYLRYHTLDAFAGSLSKAFVDENFDFNDHILQGTKQQRPRWKRCTAADDAYLGEALGQVYVAKAFPPAANTRAHELVQNLQATLNDDIGTLAWMSPATKTYAKKKLAAYAKKIGYPKKWIDYSAYHVGDDSYAGNVERGRRFAWNHDLHKIGRPLDRGQFGMSPPTVNAYYNPQLNEIVFPAGILQPPFFNENADDAINYGAIGAVIGHEMTHGFDDQGRQYDAVGNLTDWWTKSDAVKFAARANCIVKQADNYAVLPGVHENGKLVQGEAIADLGGLTIAYKAFERSLRGKPHPAPIDGLTAEQRFFIGWAQVWAETSRTENTKLLINTDPHPAPSFRVNATLANMPEFANAFSCKAKSAMVRPASQRCEIW